MDWLMHNPIAEMYGPHFLVLYGTVIILTLATSWFMLRNRAESRFSDDEPFGTDVVQEAENGGWGIKLVGALVIAGLGGYKLLVALSEGRHNVLFLVLMGLGSLWVLFTMSPGPRRDARDWSTVVGPHLDSISRGVAR
jgi:hypothetical protein